MSKNSFDLGIGIVVKTGTCPILHCLCLEQRLSVNTQKQIVIMATLLYLNEPHGSSFINFGTVKQLGNNIL